MRLVTPIRPHPAITAAELSRARGGRPSREAAAQLDDRILDAAQALFTAGGYGSASVDAVAERAQVSKRTLYHRHADKAALFRAVVHRIIGTLRADAGPTIFEGDDIEQVLRRIAGLMLRAALTPEVLALHRLVLAEAQRFPELAAAVAAEGSATATVEIARLLERGCEAGALGIENAGFAAAAFMQLVIAVPQRRALGLGTPMSPAELENWASYAVSLFLDGCRCRPMRGQGI